jgi:hypothetical protein
MSGCCRTASSSRGPSSGDASPMTTWRGQPTSAIGRSSASAPDVTSCRHADPLPWFENYPNGDLLAQARADFGGMLLTPETVAHERASGPE